MSGQIKNHDNNFTCDCYLPRIYGNKTRQGYARKRTLKLVGYLFLEVIK